MKRYTHKPIPVIAVRFTGDNMDEVRRFFDNSQYSDYEIIEDHLIKDIFLFFDRDWEGRGRDNPINFKEGDYFFTEKAYKSDILVGGKYFGKYVVDFLEQAEFERKYEGGS